MWVGTDDTLCPCSVNASLASAVDRRPSCGTGDTPRWGGRTTPRLLRPRGTSQTVVGASSAHVGSDDRVL